MMLRYLILMLPIPFGRKSGCTIRFRRTSPRGGAQCCLSKAECLIRLRRLQAVIENIVAGKNLRCEERPPNEDEKGVLKVSAVTWGNFDPLAAKTLPKSFVPAPQTRVQAGDFLISRANTLELGAPPNLFLSDKILRLE